MPFVFFLIETAFSKWRTNGADPYVIFIQNILHPFYVVIICSSDILSPDTTPQVLLHSLLECDVVLDRFEIAVPSLDEIFIQVVAEGRKKP